MYAESFIQILDRKIFVSLSWKQQGKIFSEKKNSQSLLLRTIVCIIYT